MTLKNNTVILTFSTVRANFFKYMKMSSYTVLHYEEMHKYVYFNKSMIYCWNRSYLSTRVYKHFKITDIAVVVHTVK